MTFDAATKRRFVVVLGLLTAMGALSVDMSLAAIPAMAPALGTSISSAQQIIGVFILGIGLGQIPAGLMADRVGRIPVIVVGATIFTIAAALTAIAPSIELMLLARFVQGLGAAVGIVLSRAIVRDIATGREAARMLSLMVMIFTIAPMLAPIVGGWLVVEIGWRAPFAAVAIFGASVLGAVLVFLEETGSPSKEHHIVRQLVVSARDFFAHRQSILGILLVVLPSMGFMSVISGASALIIEIYGYTPGQFGFIFAMGGLSIMIGSMINRQLLRRLNNLQMAGIGALLIGTGGVQLLAIAILGDGNFWWLWGSVCLFLSGISFLFSNATAMALDPVPHVAGASASMIGTIQNTFASGSAITAGLIYDGTVSTSVILMGCFGTLAFVVFLGRNLILREPQYLWRREGGTA
jgi:DHA1 family bicyclomycin/chloramphenicol resistance-like MFS transporter